MDEHSDYALEISVATQFLDEQSDPDGDRYVFALGAGYSPSSNLTLDMAYIYLREETVSINKHEADKGSYQADYRNAAHALSAQATWRF